ncbi:MAG: sulfatase family protein [Steroidobacter sp.]
MSSASLTRRTFLSRSTVLLAASCAPAAFATSAKPNIVFILADDLGFADLSVYGRRDYETRHLDRLAREGVRFTQAYSNSAVCSATRFALLTGRYQYRLRGGLEEPIRWPNAALGLPPSHPTLPSLLKRAGYATALIGKWHLGYLPEYGPLKSGYDEFFGNYGSAVDYFTHRGVGDGQAPAPKDLFEGEVPVEKTGYYTRLLADRAATYLSRKRTEPFFLSLHFTAPHWPWEGPNDGETANRLKDIRHYDGGSLQIYAQMVLALDDAVGRVLATLEAQGLSDNTLVVFTSDNGGERFSDNWPFSGQKTELLEGGIRVPAIVRWPAKLTSGVCEQVAISMDWLPTLLAAAGASPDPAYPPDGEDLLPVLTNQRPSHPRTLYWRYKANEQRALRTGDFKYLKINGTEYLFDLAIDVRERANLAQKRAEKLTELRGKWEQWNAQMLPISEDAFSHGLSSKQQADHYFTPPPSAAK